MRFAALLIALAATQAKSADAAAVTNTRLICEANGSVRVEIDNTVADVEESTENEVPGPETGPTSGVNAPLDDRTADCISDGHRIRARTSWFEEQWGGWHSRDPAMFVRLWVDRQPLSIVLRAQYDERLSVHISVPTKQVKACRTSQSEEVGKAQRCTKAPFTLGPVDPVEFALSSAFPGPQGDVLVLEAKDEKLCRAFAAYFDGGPAPAKRTEPKAFPAPEPWRGWSDTSYQLDADNDGDVDDVGVIDIEQYLLHGTVIAVFERDSVLSGRIPAPWWGDLMTIAMHNDNGTIKRPRALKAAVWGGPLGLSGNTKIKLHIVDGTTYAQITPGLDKAYRPMMEDDRKALSPIETARRDTQYTEVVVKTLPGMKAAPVCKFTRRSQNFE